MHFKYCKISKPVFDSLINNEIEINDFLNYIENKLLKNDYLFLNETWDLINFILNGKSLFEANEEMPLIFGSNKMEQSDLKEYGYRYITNDQIKQCLQDFEGLDFTIIKQNFDFSDIENTKVYFDKTLSQKELLEKTLNDFEALKSFLISASKDDSAIIVFFE